MPGPEHWYADPAAGWYVTVSASAVVAASVVTSVSPGAGAGVVTGGVAEVVVTAGAGAGLGAAPPHPGTTAGQLHTLGRVSSYWIFGENSLTVANLNAYFSPRDTYNLCYQCAKW